MAETLQQPPDEQKNKEDEIEGTRCFIKSPFPNGEVMHVELTDPQDLEKLRKFFELVQELNVLRLRLPLDCFEEAGNSIDDLKKSVDKFNRAVDEYRREVEKDGRKAKDFGEWGHRSCSYEVANKIVSLAKEFAIPDANVLNHHYLQFSSETYGETHYEQMLSICEELNIGEKDVFVDLGSGVGQLVCFMSAYAQCKAYGIELAKVPAEFAHTIGKLSQSLLAYFGKKSGSFELHRGDFMEKKFRETIEKATVLYLNNVLFDPLLSHRLITEILIHLKPGTKIVSTNALTGLKENPINERTAGDFSSIAVTKKLRTVENPVSWTESGNVQFYCTTIDHIKLFKYYADEIARKQAAKENQTPVKKRSVDRPKKANTGNKKEKEMTAPANQAAEETQHADGKRPGRPRLNEAQKKQKEKERRAYKRDESEEYLLPSYHRSVDRQKKEKTEKRASVGQENEKRKRGSPSKSATKDPAPTEPVAKRPVDGPPKNQKDIKIEID